MPDTPEALPQLPSPLHEALPASCTVQPELTVLPESFVAHLEAYEGLAVQLCKEQQPLVHVADMSFIL